MKAESDYGFGDTGDTGNTEGGDTSGDKPALSENLMHVSVYFDSFNTRYIINQKVYEVRCRISG